MIAALLAATALVGVSPADGAAFFEEKIRPVLIASCYSCHGGDKVKSGLRLEKRADLIKGGQSFGFGKRDEVQDYDKIKTSLLAECEKFFRPEFINRLDEIIVFRPLVKDDLYGIIDIEPNGDDITVHMFLHDMKQRLRAYHSVNVSDLQPPAVQG